MNSRKIAGLLAGLLCFARVALAQTYPQPYIQDFQPPSGPVGTHVTVTGSGFTSANAVWVGAGHDAAFVVNSDTSMSITVPADASSGQIAIFNPVNAAFSGSDFTLTVQAGPALTGFSPTAGPPGASVTLNGSNFTGASSVKFNGTVASFTVTNPTTITATVPTGATTGTISVTSPNGTATSGSSFTVQPAPQPYILDFQPQSGVKLSQITVTGNGFTGATAVYVGNGHDATFTVTSDTAMTVTVPNDATTGQIAIFNPVNAAFSGSTYTVTASSTPSITGFTPTTAPTGSQVQISGTNFSGVTAVKFNGVNASSYQVNSVTQITAVVAASATTGPISVTTSSGTATSSSSFTVSAYAQPYISSFTPTSGKVGASVTITGTGFTGANEVWFGNAHNSTFTVQSDTRITATVPSGATTGKITVANPAHSAASSSNFTVTTSGPSVSSFSPTSGPVGTSVAITGTGFTSSSVVKFNATQATSVTYNSSTSLTTLVPSAAASGPIAVTVGTATGQSAASFAVTVPPNAPTVTSITPASGSVGTGVTIKGTNLWNATAVNFGNYSSVNAGQTAFVNVVPDGTSITVGVPSFRDANGNLLMTPPFTVQVTVQTPNGSVTSPASFNVLATPPKPTITSFSPASGAVGQVVTVSGTNLTGAVVATLNGMPAAEPTSVTATSLQMVVPAGANNGIISISTRGGTASSSTSFTVTGSSNTALPVGNYSVVNGQIRNPANQVVPIRGVSVFGFNGSQLIPQFLWTMTWKEQMEQVKALGFNTVRLPIVPDTIHVTTTLSGSGAEGQKNPDLVGLTPLQILDKWMAYANTLHLYVLMDMHSNSAKSQFFTWFNIASGEYNGPTYTTWNQLPYTTTDWTNDLVAMAVRYKTNPYFMGLDVFNEPEGRPRWTAGDPNVSDTTLYWKAAVESVSAAILASTANPNLLIFVEGCGPDYDGRENSNIPINFGEDLQLEAPQFSPLNISASKLVLSPHTYGPETYFKPTFNDPSYPANLKADWDTLFGTLYPAHAVVPGEWGGHYGQNDSGSGEVADPRGTVWMKTFVNYMITSGNTNSFFWDYYPNSNDTSGVMTSDPFTYAAGGVRTDKMDLLLHLWSGTPIPN